MSKIHFHSPSGTLSLAGTERAWAASLTNSLAIGVLTASGLERELVKFMPQDAYPVRNLKTNSPSFRGDFSIWASGYGDQNAWVVGHDRFSCWEMNLNTAMAVGNESVQFCARLHGQCEIHLRVEPHNRDWFAGVIEQGLERNILRSPNDHNHHTASWRQIAAWLLDPEKSHEPVVTSYSVTRQFPNHEVAGWDEARFETLPKERQWQEALRGLRENGPEFRHDGLDRYRIGHGRDAMWLLDQLKTRKNPKPKGQPTDEGLPGETHGSD